MRTLFARCVSNIFLASLYLLLPVLPFLASLFFWRRKFVFQYAYTVRKCATHIYAMGAGPAMHYFHEVAGQVKGSPPNISGSCVQCGNCCMEHKCMFLEPLGDDKFGCGIYNSYWRRFSNCSSFPLSQHDIDRYACPSYYVDRAMPIHFHRTPAACAAPSVYS